MLRFILPLMLIFELAFPRSQIDCRIFEGYTNECNPYTTRFLHTTVIKYDQGEKRLISIKSLPVPAKKATLRVIPIEDMIEKHVQVYESKRFKGSDYTPLAVKPVKKEEEILPEEKRWDGIQKREFIRMTTELEAKEEIQQGVYTVVSGDVLSRIAKKFNLKTASLRELNELPKGSILKIGQKLTIPMSQEMIDAITEARYKVKRGDSFISIAKMFGLDAKTLADFNRIKSSASLRIGRILELPLPHRLEQLSEEKRYSTYGTKNLRVTATAYTSHKDQTEGNPFVGAWNNRLVPGSKVIAVSRDLLKVYGLSNGTKVRISGLPGIYRVRDKMNKRFKKRIDIYMGLDRNKAVRWGRRSVVIYWD